MALRQPYPSAVCARATALATDSRSSLELCGIVAINRSGVSTCALIATSMAGAHFAVGEDCRSEGLEECGEWIVGGFAESTFI